MVDLEWLGVGYNYGLIMGENRSEKNNLIIKPYKTVGRVGNPYI